MGLCEKERGYFGVCSWHDEMNECLDGKYTFPAGMCKVTPDVQDVTGGGTAALGGCDAGIPSLAASKYQQGRLHMRLDGISWVVI